MKSATLITLALSLFIFSVPSMAQTTEEPSSKQETPAKPQVQHNTIATEDIKLAKDMDYKVGERTPAQSLEIKYGVQNRSQKVRQQDDIRTDLAKIRVITPEAYEGLPDERKAAIDANPFFFVTEKTRKQKMADYVIENTKPNPDQQAGEKPEVPKETPKSTFGDD